MHPPHRLQDLDAPGRAAATLDARLPGLELLLHPTQVSALVARHLAAGHEVVDGCEASSVHYEPATGCVVTYALPILDANGDIHRVWLYGKCHTESNFGAALAGLASARWSPVSGIPPVIPVESARVIFYVFPNDARLEGLRLLAYPNRLRRFLALALADYPPPGWYLALETLRVEAARWQAESHGLVRVRTRMGQRVGGTFRDLCLVLHAHVDARGERLFRLLEWLTDHRSEFSGPGVPRPLAWGALRHLFVVEDAVGTPLGTHWDSEAIETRLAEVGHDLATLQRASGAPAPTRPVHRDTNDAVATAHTLTRLLPHEAGRIDRIAGSLTKLAPRDPTQLRFVHGDFHPGRVMVQESGLVFLDFDRSHHGEGAADVGNFLAHLALAEIEGCRNVGARLAQVFLDAYESTAGRKIDPGRLLFYTLLGLFRACVRPFRELRPAWAHQTLQILNACEDLVV